MEVFILNWKCHICILFLSSFRDLGGARWRLRPKVTDNQENHATLLNLNCLSGIVTKLSFGCSSLKNLIMKDKCRVKGKIALLKKPAILGRRWTHAPPPKQLPTSWVLLRDCTGKEERAMCQKVVNCLFSEMTVSITRFQVDIMSHLWLEHYLSHKSLHS